MAKDIFVIQTMGDALRNTGYKNIECAMAEIIDNSIQAEAKDILIIVSEEYNPETGRNNIKEIGFLDDGKGMEQLELESCLGIGYSTRTDRKGMGRFGVGLPQASLYACPSVDVYSWQNGYDNCKKVFLDINKVKDGAQTVLEDPVQSEIPSKYKKYLTYKMQGQNDAVKEYNFMESGTFVLWKNCDRVVPKTVSFLFKKLEFALGQKFRYFIHDGICNISLIHHENQDNSKRIMPNDPLFLMKPNYVLGNPATPENICPGDNINYTESIFEPYTDEKHTDGVIYFPIQYIDKITGETKEHNIEIRFSKVKKEFYDKTAVAGDPGGKPLGSYVKKLEGISIVRANREIDFGQFDFYENINQSQHRWWGCEIKFDPVLDEAFGVANNKQFVELRKIDKDDYLDEPVKPVWVQLYSIIHPTIERMYKENKKTRENARSSKDIDSPTTKIINKVEESEIPNEESESAEVRRTTSKEELYEKSKQQLEERGVIDPQQEEIVNNLKNQVNIDYQNMGKLAALFDYSFGLGNCYVKFNMDHIFYKTFLEDLIKSNDAKVAFELFVASLVKAIDETNRRQEDENDNLIATWNEKLRKYINAQHGSLK